MLNVCTWVSPMKKRHVSIPTLHVDPLSMYVSTYYNVLTVNYGKVRYCVEFIFTYSNNHSI